MSENSLKFVQKDYTAIIHKSDESAVVTETRPIFLNEDVKIYFPNSESVNNALHSLILSSLKSKFIVGKPDYKTQIFDFEKFK